MEIVVKHSQDPQVRECLLQIDIVHRLIEISLSVCKAKTGTGSEECANEAVSVLYNLGRLERTRFYIPGATAKENSERTRFYLWGGFLALVYIASNAKDKVEYCAKKMSELDLRYYEDLVKLLRLYLGGSERLVKTVEDEDLATSAQKLTNVDSCSPQDVAFPA